jgi:hypothetical protein
MLAGRSNLIQVLTIRNKDKVARMLEFEAAEGVAKWR